MTLRPPATLTTACPTWCCMSPWPPGRLWRAARPARSPPAATPWQPPGTGPSSPGSGVWPSPPAGCCPWQAGWGPWMGADPVGATHPLARAGWAFGLSHRCGGGCTGLQKWTLFSPHLFNTVEVSSKPVPVCQFLLDLVSFKNLKCAGIITTVPYRSHSCCPCSAPGRRPGTTGWSRGDASCECRRAPGPSQAPRTSPRRALGSAGPACAPDALSARFLSGWSPGGPCTLQSTPLEYRWEVRRCLVIVQSRQS